ncbi:MAG: DUF4038 domain-containing protein [Phaeodactylibacter sp.]|uniref:apiosidase-like domain-containing protein n=1 Tax=Phaeodactylibacter sp. TaxID=1940289 RepID=UPI0032EDBB85
MKTTITSIIFIFLSISLCGQAPPNDEGGKRLIVRADDLGYTHSANSGIYQACSDGIATTMEVMAPSPWFMEAVEVANSLDTDVGIHLTLTSEWEKVRWRPLTHAPSLTDEDGYFYRAIWPNPNFPEGSTLQEHDWKLEEVERELRAQIELVLKHLPQTSHMTMHMGALSMNEDSRQLLRKLGRDYALDIFTEDYEVQRLPFKNDRSLTIDEQAQLFAHALEQAAPGTYLMVTHPAHDTPEQNAVHLIGKPPVAHDRQQDLDLLTHPIVKAAIRDQGVQLIGYRELPPTQLPRLRVAANGRYLEKENGAPFFYLGDTAWELFHRLDREDAATYLRDRAGKGFNVIQAVVLAEIDGLFIPNPYGHVPLDNLDPKKPVEGYFEHVDYIVEQAERLGLYIGMLPTWGDKVNLAWGVGPEIFTPENAFSFGRFLGQRYKDKPIIWILGGDRKVETQTHRDIWNAMAEGIKEGDGGQHLMTYHPQGGTSSSDFFHGSGWLDFNMHQSGHGEAPESRWTVNQQDRALKPVKPSLDGEPCYEDIPKRFWEPSPMPSPYTLSAAGADTVFKAGWFDAHDVRNAAYWSVLSGACGHTYGNNNIWQMYEYGRKPNVYPRSDWKTALSHPGAAQMGYMRQLFESRDFRLLVPDADLLLNDPGSGFGKMMAAVASDGSYAYAYTPMGEPVQINLKRLGKSNYTYQWFDPRTGELTEARKMEAKQQNTFQPPATGPKQDWVLSLQRED